MKIGLVLPQYGIEVSEALRFADLAEKLGFDSLWVEDHFMPWQLEPEEPALEGWTLLTFVAARTSRIRLGTLVSSLMYRHPALLAKMAATLDSLSGGRFSLGLGVGWYRDEIDAYGIPFPPFRERAERLREAIRLIKTLWRGGRASFDGKYYRLRDAPFSPPPLQRPRPPIIIGTGGERIMMRIVAEEADGWNYGALTPKDFKSKLKALERHCGDVGRDIGEIEKSLELYVFVGETKGEAMRLFEDYRESVPRDGKLQHVIQDLYLNTAIIGDPETVADRLKEYGKAGVDHLMLVLPGKEKIEMLRTLGREVLPRLK